MKPNYNIRRPEGRRQRPVTVAGIDALMHSVIDPVKMVRLIERLYRLAMDGDLTAARTLLERMYGKTPQLLEHTGAGGGPMEFEAIIQAISEIKKGEKE